LKKVRSPFVILLGCLLWAGAVHSRDGESITLNIRINYGSAYRDGSWVPVDLLVSNNAFDVNGSIEIRTFSGEEEQSPRYRIPAISPRGSQKRFRVNCRLDQTTRIEAMLYHGKRKALDVTPWLTVRPIRDDDVLALILDDEPLTYGFLHKAVQEEGVERRFHMESLRNSQLRALADHPENYKTFDLIILGNINPTLIGKPHQQLLENYVRDGGIVVVCLGRNGPAYRGTWVERFLGVQIGSQEVWDEDRLAEAVFPPEERGGVKEHRSCTFSSLIPMAQEVKTLGREHIISTIRPVGKGYFVGVAVDASSRALQDCEGFQKMWRELSLYGAQESLNFARAFSLSEQALPHLSGVRVHTKKSVLTYLILYFVLAIVVNWFFWNRVKRRELAWVCLIIFSVGFTTYAMVYGTTGRAKSSEINRIDILRIPPERGTAMADSFVGIQTVHSSRHDFTLPSNDSLAVDYRTSLSNQARKSILGFLSGSQSRPFLFVQDNPAEVKNFSVRASLMRFLHVKDRFPSPGGMTGTLVLDEKGLHGQLKNLTGFPLQNPFLFFNGNHFELKKMAIKEGANDIQSWDVSILPERLKKAKPRSQLANSQYLAQMLYPYPSFYRPKNLNEFKAAFFRDLLPKSEYQPFLYPYLDPRLLICGWTNQPIGQTIRPNKSIPENIRETLVLAEINFENRLVGLETFLEIPLHVMSITNKAGPQDSNWFKEDVHYFWGGAFSMFQLFLPRWLKEKASGKLLFEFSWYSPKGLDFYLTTGNIEDNSWSKNHIIEESSEEIDGYTIHKAVYEIKDLKNINDDFMDLKSNNNSFGIRTEGYEKLVYEYIGSYKISAKFIDTSPIYKKGRLEGWK